MKYRFLQTLYMWAFIVACLAVFVLVFTSPQAKAQEADGCLTIDEIRPMLAALDEQTDSVVILEGEIQLYDNIAQEFVTALGHPSPTSVTAVYIFGTAARYRVDNEAVFQQEGIIIPFDKQGCNIAPPDVRMLEGDNEFYRGVNTWQNIVPALESARLALRSV